MRRLLAWGASGAILFGGIACVGGGGSLPEPSGDTGKAEKSPSAGETPGNTGVEKPAAPPDDDTADAASVDASTRD